MDTIILHNTDYISSKKNMTAVMLTTISTVTPTKHQCKCFSDDVWRWQIGVAILLMVLTSLGSNECGELLEKYLYYFSESFLVTSTLHQLQHNGLQGAKQPHLAVLFVNLTYRLQFSISRWCVRGASKWFVSGSDGRVCDQSGCGRFLYEERQSILQHNCLHSLGRRMCLLVEQGVKSVTMRL